jgi:hypothetical protein
MPCGKGKQRYIEKSDAKAAKRQINKSYSDKKITNIYWCEDCSAYHLTSMPKKKSRKITRLNNKKCD